MNLADLAEVTPTTTKVDVTARNDAGHFLHRWIITPREMTVGSGLRQDIREGKTSIVIRNINWHGRPNRGGYPEIGWGVDWCDVPQELLNAEGTHLGMRCSEGVQYDIYVDVRLPEIAWGTVKGWGDDDD